MDNKVLELKALVEKSNNIVFFGGAGVSTESGIPDFRSKDGLYNQIYKFPPEEILSHTFFINNTNEFYKFYKDKMNPLAFKPNITHLKLSELERIGKLKAIVTQNIDGLHQSAGSKCVYELHGSVFGNYCLKCNNFYNADYVFSSIGVPICTCGGIIKPDVVLYEEALNETVFSDAIYKIQNCDLFIIGGTSLTVFPASSLINYYKGDKLVLINNDETPYDNRANLVIHNKLSNVFAHI